ncbi:MAG: hypothetical protein HRT93_03455 [Piscirickettsiaceae bacterium]|nr:hypothetical protein [Piscirickettsiaceae bacterium]
MVGAAEKDDEHRCSFCGINDSDKKITLVKSDLTNKTICNLCVADFKEGIDSKPEGITPAAEFIDNSTSGF